ncbi:tyrosine-protein kinase ABL2-like [Dendronephthya gigantea]|uniref:tyrosine-protein kinase ABL2-like n=1 Tax=Dendronephthya gigantea TaxID=151771 RepID=UPI00106BB6C9|nr:tyrosine-protein kinase ABL2-like [Dendronephthya gigantea]
MKSVDILSSYFLIAFTALWINGSPHKISPERCRLFFLNATAAFHKDNRQPTREKLEKIIPLLTPVYPNSTFSCEESTVTLEDIKFSSCCALNATRLDLVFKVEPNNADVQKIFAYHCSENMLTQASGMFTAVKVEELLRFRENRSISAPTYVVDEKSCCKEQDRYNEPCCRAGYTLKNTTCVSGTGSGSHVRAKEGSIQMEETINDCEPNVPALSVGVIIFITCGSLVLFVGLVLAGVRIWKSKRRHDGNGYVEAAVETNPGPQEEPHEDTAAEITVSVQAAEETTDGYLSMKGQTTENTTIDPNITTNSNTNANTSTSNEIPNHDDNKQNSLALSKPVTRKRPLSRQEMQFDFDMHIAIEDIDFTNKMLGRGQFGQVELANVLIKGIRTKCAVKMIRGRGTYEDERELFQELQMLYQIPYHPNVVSLLGGCMEANSPLYVIVEYCEKGSLLKYLQNSRNNFNEYVNMSIQKLDFRWKLKRAMEICSGMIFLSQRQILHRDLAARNILLDENEVAKIADFGMAKDVYLRGMYCKETSGFLPVRWMAIEAIESCIYTVQSDIWSFGILLWELYMDGVNPYPGIANGNELLEKYLKQGYRMAQPENCPDSFYQLMQRCWLANPEDRPKFAQALREMELIEKEEMRRESEASRMTQSSRMTEDSDDLPVFEEDEELLETPEKEANVPLKVIRSSQENVETSSESECPAKVPEIGIVNRGRSSVDSGTNAFELRSLRRNSDDQTSHC